MESFNKAAANLTTGLTNLTDKVTGRQQKYSDNFSAKNYLSRKISKSPSFASKFLSNVPGLKFFFSKTCY